jgi:hypothetical protein
MSIHSKVAGETNPGKENKMSTVQKTKKSMVVEVPPSKKELMEVMGEQVDRSITVCLRPRYNWGATTKNWEAAYRKTGRPLSLVAAEKLIEAFKEPGVAIVSTGWPIPPVYPEGEICGLAGVSSMARGLSIALGVRSVFAVEKPTMGPLRAVAQAAELRVWDYDVWNDRPAPYSTAFYDFPVDDEEAKKAAKRLLDETDAKAVISIERTDVNEKGIPHSGLGLNMASHIAKIYHLVNEANERGILTIGMGEVGNEIGFGNIHDEVTEIIKPFGKKCNCGCGGGIIGTTPVDCLVVARASNCGAYGVLACLAGLLEKPAVLHSVEIQRRMMEAAMNYPVYDSLTVRNTFTDDGAPGDLTLHLIDQLRWITEIPTWENPFFEKARSETGA